MARDWTDQERLAAMPFGSEDSVDFTDDLIGFGRVHGMRAGTGSSRSMDKEIAKSKFKPREIVAEIVSEGESCHENVTQAWLERSGRVSKPSMGDGSRMNCDSFFFCRDSTGSQGA